MKQKKENSMALLLHWAGEQKFWLFLAILLSMCSGLCIIVPYIGIYRLMDATFNNACTKELVVQTVAMIAAAVTLRFVLFGCSGVAAHKGAYGALFKVRCMVAEHMARAPLGALNERRTGDIKTVLNEDIEKLELFLAHNLPDLVCYLVGPVVIFIYLMTVNVPLALISLVPLVLAVVVMGIMFRNTDDLMERANQSITALNSVMIEYISGMKLIKAYNMGSKSFRKLSDAIQEENSMWNETSRRMGPPYAAFVVIIECGMLLMVPIGGMFFLKGSLAASTLLLFVYQGNPEIKYFNCSNYKGNRGTCQSTHYIRVDFLEEVVLGEIRRLTKFASLYEDDFLKAVIGHSQQADEADRKLKEKELKALLARDEELDGLFERIYEDNVSGKISDERFSRMSRRYEDEQKELTEKIKQLRSEIEKQSSRTMTTDMFISLVRKYTRAKKLTPRMLNELVEKIEVFNAEKVNGVWEQRLRIHYNCVGTIEIPSALPLPTPDVSVNTRKGVVVNYAPCDVAI